MQPTDASNQTSKIEWGSSSRLSTPKDVAETMKRQHRAEIVSSSRGSVSPQTQKTLLNKFQGYCRIAIHIPTIALGFAVGGPIGLLGLAFATSHFLIGKHLLNNNLRGLYYTTQLSNFLAIPLQQANNLFNQYKQQM